MSHEQYRPDVAKYGGSSAAYLQEVWEQDQHPDNQVPIMVLSGPGCDREGRFTERLTDTFLNGGGLAEAQIRFAAVMLELPKNPAVEEVFENMPADFERWKQEDHAMDALPEYWSAKFFAALSGREFVDATEIIHLDNDGEIDFERSAKAIRSRFRPRKQYVVPGYYARRPDGRIDTLGRGGSDTTGALLAVALESPHYLNYINEDGIRSGNPNQVEGTIVQPEATYREMGELEIGGCEAVAGSALRYLQGSGVETVICNTFGEGGNRGTFIREDRDWKGSPLLSITGRDDLIGLRLHVPGVNDQVGGTTKLFDALRHRNVPYNYVTTATDDIAVIAASDFEADLEKVRDDMRQLLATDVEDLLPYGAIHFVGEGIAERRRSRREILGAVTLTLGEYSIEDYGDANNGYSPSFTMFVDPLTLRNDAEHNSLRIAHEAGFETAKTGEYRPPEFPSLPSVLWPEGLHYKA